MSDRNLTTTVAQVFGDVQKGDKCRVCGRDVDDARSKHCSDYCSNIVSAVMRMLNWSSVRRQIIKRDDETCQECGFDYAKEKQTRKRIRALIKEKAGDRPEGPSALDIGERDEDFDWDSHYEEVREWNERRDELKERYGDPYEHETSLHVDHITPVSEGGHPFDPGNLQTLCEDCHQEKTAREAAERAQTPSASELNKSILQYVTDGENNE